MQKHLKKHTQMYISLAILAFMVVATIVVIIYGKGYQIAFDKGRPEIAGTGLLVATSNPDGAQVFINDHLTTATNNTINLAPGTYKVKIYKDGFFSWQKDITVQKEIVSKAEAWLLPTAPKLESITDLGVNNPVVDPTGTKIAFTVASQSAAKKNGIYVFSMNTSPIPTLQSAITQIADDSTDALSTSTLSWSPDGQSLLASIPATDTRQATTYLLSATGFNSAPQDVTETLNSVLQQWSQQKTEKQLAQVNALKAKLREFVNSSFSILAWSPDETKILYTASQSATIPEIIVPPLLGRDSTPEQRTIQKGSVYVYDVAEDKNYLIATDGTDNMISWLPDSKHLLNDHDKKVDVMEYDGQNTTTVYAGPFLENFVTSWPNGSNFVILTNLGNSAITPNLYTVSLK